MKNHRRKLIAPIVIAVIMVLYYVLYFGLLVALTDGAVRWIIGIVPIAFAAVTIGVCIERIKEIKGGEEDDISKY